LSRNKLYGILLVACLAGYTWVAYNMLQHMDGYSHFVGVCMIRQTTGVPCPSCGTTRSVLSLLNGDVLQALYLNPFGFIVLSIMFAAPVWILSDLLRKKDTLFGFYQKTEARLRMPGLAIPLVSLVIINWIWNIYKDL
jgi:hypothetical protein